MSPQIQIIVYTLIVSLVLAAALGFLLGVFKKVFHVDVDETVSRVRAALPGANCGGCGYPGCDGLAAAIAAGDAPVNACPVGGAAVAKEVGAIMGVDASAVSKVSVLLCSGSSDKCLPKAAYVGVRTCQGAKLSTNGTKCCDWGCIGFGDCERSCPFGAIAIGANGLPQVDYAKCTGCGVCVAKCPQKILTCVPKERTGSIVLCSNWSGKKGQVAKDCKAGCIKCGKCERVCPKQCIKVTNGLPLVDYAICDSCGECVRNCPVKVLTLIEHKIQTV